jgi:hypothetical protein
VDTEDNVEEIREFVVGDMKTSSLLHIDAFRRATTREAASFFDSPTHPLTSHSK